MSRKVRFVICGVVYARNLGDGIIAECLGHALGLQSGGTEVSYADLGCRTGYDSRPIRRKDFILKVLRHLPQIISFSVSGLGVVRFYISKARTAWSNLFRPSDLVIFGGGHLLSDYYLNFPTKLAFLARHCHKAGAVLVIHGVGVARNWSWLGGKLLARVVREARYISVRDEHSRSLLKEHIPDLHHDIQVEVDPAYICQSVYEHTPPSGNGIGISISDSAELASYDLTHNARLNFDDFWTELIEHYVRSGRHVTLFTNGADEDERYCSLLMERLSAAGVGHEVSRVARSSTPGELVGIIKGLDLLISHRLHAHIAAFSHGIPSVAIGWDEKLLSQFRIMDREAFLIGLSDLSVDRVIALADEAERSPIPREARERLAGSVHDGVARLLSHFT